MGPPVSCRSPVTGRSCRTRSTPTACLVGTPDGRGLIVVRSTPGELYGVDLRTGHATRIALVGAVDDVNGDGLVRDRPHVVRRTEPPEQGVHQGVRAQ